MWQTTWHTLEFKTAHENAYRRKTVFLSCLQLQGIFERQPEIPSEEEARLCLKLTLVEFAFKLLNVGFSIIMFLKSPDVLAN